MNDLPIESFTNSELLKLKNDLDEKNLKLTEDLRKNMEESSFWREKYQSIFSNGFIRNNELHSQLNGIASIQKQVDQEIEKRRTGGQLTDEDLLSQEDKDLRELIAGIENISNEELLERMKEVVYVFCGAIIKKGEIWEAQLDRNDPEVRMLLQRGEIQTQKKLALNTKLGDALRREKERRGL